MKSPGLASGLTGEIQWSSANPDHWGGALKRLLGGLSFLDRRRSTMGVNMLECQVQRGVTLEVNAVVNGARIGFNQPTRLTPAFLSHLRQPSHRSCRPNYKALAGTFDADTLRGDPTPHRPVRPSTNA